MIKTQHILKKIEPGDNVLIEIPQIEKRLKVEYIGWYREKCVVTTCPTNPGIKNIFINKPYVTLIFLLDGKIYSGNSYVIHCSFKPYGMLFLAEPEKLDVINLRKSDRVNCFLPGKIIVKEKDLIIEGVIIDLSVGGCGFLIKDSKFKKNLESEQDVIVKFELPTHNKELSFNANIKRFFTKGEKIGVGLCFQQKIDESKFITSYIENIKNLLE